MTGSRAIVTSPRMPWPLDDGGRIGLWQTVYSIAREWSTTLIVMVSPEEMEQAIPAPILDLGVEVVRVPHRASSMVAAGLRGLLGRWPLMLERYRSPRFSAALRDEVARLKPDFVFFNHLHLGTYVEDVADVTTILREHNVEWLWLDRHSRSLRNPLSRAYVKSEAKRMKRCEAELCGRMDLVLAVQPEEGSLLRSLAPESRVEVIPVGVDFARFELQRPPRTPVVLLIGSFGRTANIEGAEWFLARGWRRVRERVPDATLRVVGKDLPGQLRPYDGKDGVQIVGYVERAEAEFAGASLMVVPLWAGAGARVKIVEALAARTPVVATMLAVEGLGLTDGSHYLGGETPEALATAAITLLTDGTRAARLADAGHSLARSAFSIEAVARNMNRMCREAAQRNGGNRVRERAPVSNRHPAGELPQRS